jgi:hypothetical protein
VAPEGATIDVTTAGGGPVQITAATTFTADVSFEGFTFSGNAVNKVAGAGAGIKIFTLLNCTIDSTLGGSGVTTGGGGPNRMTIDGCHVTAPMANQVGANIGGADGELIVLNSTFDNFGAQALNAGGDVAYLELRNSIFSNPTGESVNFWNLRGDAVVDRCYFHKARGGGDNFLIWGEDAVFDVTITNSVFDSSTADAGVPGNNQNLVACNIDGKTIIRHCTVVANNGAANHQYGWQISGNADCEIVNCITVGWTVDDYVGDDPSYTMTNNWNTASGDPGFVFPATYSPTTYIGLTGDFNPRADSPCRDAGIDVGILVDYEGKLRDATPDIGAFEYVSLEPTPTPGPTRTPVPGAGVDDRWDLYE